jgi:8-oxo-dGTP pyrophosphatase MutT (NUDIX family)
MSFHQNTQQSYCSNCGGSGHTFRQCIEPVSSYGVLVFRWVGRSPTWTQSTEFCKNNRSPTGLVNIVPEVLMIQRKDSLGFMDIMRGKYKVTEPEYIKKQLRGMTERERERLLNDEFEDIWNDLWGSDAESSMRYAHDRIVSKQKLAELRAGIENPSGDTYTLADLLRQEPSVYKTPEWGFPKGRRDACESDIDCAFRELFEETSISSDELWKVINVAPLIEQFYGSNDVHYRHSYYLAQYIGKRDIHFDILNTEMAKEIGSMAWKPLDEAIILLRPENVEKRGILVQLAGILRNFLPVFRDTLVGERLALVNENTGEEQQERYVFTSKSYSGHTGGYHGTGGATATSTGAANTRVERPKRFFGTRQTYRRVPELRSSNSGQPNEGYQSRGSTAGSRGAAVSGHRRQHISIEAASEEGVQGDATIEDHE